MIYLAVLFILAGVLIVLIALFSNIQKTSIPVKTGTDFAPRAPKKRDVVPETVHGDLHSFNDKSGGYSDSSLLSSSLEDISEEESFFDETPSIFSGESSLVNRRGDDSAVHKESQPVQEDVFLDFNEDQSFQYDSNDLLTEENDISSEEPKALDEKSVIEEIPEEPPAEKEEEVNEGNSNKFNATLFEDASNVINYDSGDAVIDPTSAAYKRIHRIGSGVVMCDDAGITFDMNGEIFRFDFRKIYDLWMGKNYVALPMENSKSVKLFLFDGFGQPQQSLENFFSEFKKG